MQRRNFMGLVGMGSLALVGSLLVPRSAMASAISREDGYLREIQRGQLMNKIWLEAERDGKLVQDDTHCASDFHRYTYGTVFRGFNERAYRVDTSYRVRAKDDFGTERANIFDLTLFNEGQLEKIFSYYVSYRDDYTQEEDSIMDLSNQAGVRVGELTNATYLPALDHYVFVGPTREFYNISGDGTTSKGTFGVDSSSCGNLHLPEFQHVSYGEYSPRETIQRATDYSDSKLNEIAEILGINQRILNIPILTKKDVENSGAEEGTVTKLALESMLI